eukprot:scaffold268452_cov36-Tisochrysis_lutea.AAC.1
MPGPPYLGLSLQLWHLPQSSLRVHDLQTPQRTRLVPVTTCGITPSVLNMALSVRLPSIEWLAAKSISPIRGAAGAAGGLCVRSGARSALCLAAREHEATRERGAGDAERERGREGRERETGREGGKAPSWQA